MLTTHSHGPVKHTVLRPSCAKTTSLSSWIITQTTKLMGKTRHQRPLPPASSCCAKTTICTSYRSHLQNSCSATTLKHETQTQTHTHTAHNTPPTPTHTSTPSFIATIWKFSGEGGHPHRTVVCVCPAHIQTYVKTLNTGIVPLFVCVWLLVRKHTHMANSRSVPGQS